MHLCWQYTFSSVTKQWWWFRTVVVALVSSHCSLPGRVSTGMVDCVWFQLFVWEICLGLTSHPGKPSLVQRLQAVTHLVTGTSTSRQYWNDFSICHYSNALNLRWPFWCTSHSAACYHNTWQMIVNSSQRLVAGDFNHPSIVSTCNVPRTRTSLGDRSFSVAGPRLWNSLPLHFQGFELSLSSFASYWKRMCVAEDSSA